LHIAVKAGRVKRAEICEQCGRGDVPIQAHHPDYSQPLVVVWLCSQCHGKQHRK
jgi:hypothetical protein